MAIYVFWGDNVQGCKSVHTQFYLVFYATNLQHAKDKVKYVSGRCRKFEDIDSANDFITKTRAEYFEREGNQINDLLRVIDAKGCKLSFDEIESFCEKPILDKLVKRGFLAKDKKYYYHIDYKDAPPQGKPVQLEDIELSGFNGATFDVACYDGYALAKNDKIGVRHIYYPKLKDINPYMAEAIRDYCFGGDEQTINFGNVMLFIGDAYRSKLRESDAERIRRTMCYDYNKEYNDNLEATDNNSKDFE